MADFRAVLLDLDGTLIDSVPQLHLAVALSLEELRLPQPGELSVRGWIGNGALKLMLRALSWAMERSATEVELAQAMQLFYRHYESCCTRGLSLYPGVIETLEALHQANVRLALITNKPSRYIAPILGALRMESLFDCCLGGDCLARRKPDPEPLFFACEQLGVSPDKALMVGDSKNDILAARNAQMAAAAVTYGYNYGEPIENSAPDWVFEDFSELAQLLL
ncbi:phosphoglycolate phosphatase [Dongshaea marina]|uniref:phosphoglycolate phosphatase n=1 Tax=Dongshaea marina TaxID=2047966 RepID=UPI000D3E653A|nr:phosphoglycolate phosphatase [Dongshaea marina]